jgi:uncharacterized membrane protein
MLPTLVESLGGQFARSAGLAAGDLDGADVLILIHPTDRWSAEPERLERIWDYVRGGGSLLVVAEPYQLQEDGQAKRQQVLARADDAVRHGDWRDRLVAARPGGADLPGDAGHCGQRNGLV